jgi:hypothetical protein
MKNLYGAKCELYNIKGLIENFKKDNRIHSDDNTGQNSDGDPIKNNSLTTLFQELE